MVSAAVAPYTAKCRVVGTMQISCKLEITQICGGNNWKEHEMNTNEMVANHMQINAQNMEAFTK